LRSSGHISGHSFDVDDKMPAQAPPTLLSVSSERREATDPDGRGVILDERTIRHLQSRRRQMIAHAAAILDAVSRPDLREDDPVPGRERFYRRDLDPRRWLRVVVDSMSHQRSL
jgi:hypothetical protein